MRLSALGEFGLIHKLARIRQSKKDVFLGIGDDAAVIVPTRGDRWTLLTTDSTIEGIHFVGSANPFHIGWKTMARNVSDIAAMGGRPRFALVSVAFPPRITTQKVLGIQKGLFGCAKAYGVSIVGGDTSRSPNGIFLNVALFGEVEREQLVTRSGARVGDIVLVTGRLGGSLAGRHLTFRPRVEEARFLATRFRPTAMIDLSDGLANDLQRLREKSRVGFEINGNQIPCSKELTRDRALRPAERIRHALEDGEDYELLFTLAPDTVRNCLEAWKRKFRLELTPIGVVRPFREGIRLGLGTSSSVLKGGIPNDHFRKRPR